MLSVWFVRLLCVHAEQEILPLEILPLEFGCDAFGAFH